MIKKIFCLNCCLDCLIANKKIIPFYLSNLYVIGKESGIGFNATSKFLN